MFNPTKKALALRSVHLVDAGSKRLSKGHRTGFTRL
jgi:hypothetical protein